MKRAYFFSLLFIFLHNQNCIAQQGDSASRSAFKDRFTFSGYLDAYYAYYSDSSGIGGFQKFTSISPRKNQFGLNTAQVAVEYNSDKVRGNITLHFGDIAKGSWSAAYNDIMEAHAGFRLCKTLWLDAGLFRTHFGTEGLLPKENFLSSVSVNTFYEPYYEAGARLNYVPNGHWAVNLYAINGYNIFEDNNKHKSLGMLVTYTEGEKWNAGYSNYLGDDAPDSALKSHLRVNQNLFFNAAIKKLKIQLGIDYCLQKNSAILHPDKGSSMLSGVLGFKYQLSEMFALATRGEFFYDPQGFMSTVILDKQNKLTGYKLWGFTLGAEYKPTKNTYIRIEGRQLQMNRNQEIFYQNEKLSSQRFELSGNVGVSF